MDRRLWALIATVFASVAALAVVGILYVNHAVTEEGRVQCDVYTLLNDSYKAAPPTTQTGRQFAAAIRKVVDQLGCEG